MPNTLTLNFSRNPESPTYEGGPNATTITFTPGEGAVLEGGVEQLTRPERHYDKTFGMEIGTSHPDNCLVYDFIVM